MKHTQEEEKEEAEKWTSHVLNTGGPLFVIKNSC